MLCVSLTCFVIVRLPTPSPARTFILLRAGGQCGSAGHMQIPCYYHANACELTHTHLSLVGVSYNTHTCRMRTPTRYAYHGTKSRRPVLVITTYDRARARTSLDCALHIRLRSGTGDEDGSGAVDRTEFAQALLALGIDAPRSDIDAIFNEFDTDSSQTIDFKELNKLLRKRAEVPTMSSRLKTLSKLHGSTTRSLLDGADMATDPAADSQHGLLATSPTARSYVIDTTLILGQAPNRLNTTALSPLARVVPPGPSRASVAGLLARPSLDRMDSADGGYTAAGAWGSPPRQTLQSLATLGGAAAVDGDRAASSYIEMGGPAAQRALLLPGPNPWITGKGIPDGRVGDRLARMDELWWKPRRCNDWLVKAQHLSPRGGAYRMPNKPNPSLRLKALQL